MYIKLFTSNADPGESPFSWDTDGIPFIIDNSATDIIRNERKLFTGLLVPTKVTLETSEGVFQPLAHSLEILQMPATC